MPGETVPKPFQYHEPLDIQALNQVQQWNPQAPMVQMGPLVNQVAPPRMVQPGAAVIHHQGFSQTTFHGPPPPYQGGPYVHDFGMPGMVPERQLMPYQSMQYGWDQRPPINHQPTLESLEYEEEDEDDEVCEKCCACCCVMCCVGCIVRQALISIF